MISANQVAAGSVRNQRLSAMAKRLLRRWPENGRRSQMNVGSGTKQNANVYHMYILLYNIVYITIYIIVYILYILYYYRHIYIYYIIIYIYILLEIYVYIIRCVYIYILLLYIQMFYQPKTGHTELCAATNMWFMTTLPTSTK